MIGELIVNGTSLDLTEGIAFPLNYCIADAKEPQKRKRNYSKEILLEGTQSNLNFFSSTYQLALSTVNNTTTVGFNFDPTIRVSAKYYNGGLLIFNGLLRLNDVVLSKGNYTFKCTLFSNFIELFMKLGDRKVSELGWSEYQHVLSRTNVINSFDTSVMLNGVNTPNFTGGNPDGWGYHYGMVDYGYTAFSTKNTTDIVPLVYFREVVEKCLAISGITFESDYFDSELFKKRLLGFGGGEKLSVPATEIANRRCNFSSVFSYSDAYGFISVSGNEYRYLVNMWLDMLSDDYGSVATLINDNFDQYFFDHLIPANGYNNAITITKQGLYNINVSQPISVIFGYGAMTNVGGIFNFRWEVLKNGTVIYTDIQEVNDLSVGYTNTFSYNAPMQLNVGDQITIRAQYYIDYKLSILTYATVETLGVSVTNDTTDFTFDLTCIQGTLQDGDTVNIERWIPDIKASTFMEGVIMEANLSFSDPDIFGVVRIEPLEDFYLDTTEFWDITQIVDHSKDIVIKPASSIEGKIYKFQWLQDNDYDNQQYRGWFTIDYGNHWYTVPSTFQTGDRIYQLPWAQTIPTDAITPFVAPRIIAVDPQTGIVKPFKGKPRTYLWNGMKSGNWRLKDTTGTGYTDLTEYPSLHHFDDWENPAFDLNWGLPILFDYPATSVTTDNLFTRYHERFVKEITGRDSKIVELYAKISNADINTLNFAKLVMWNGVLFRLNLIKDFDPNVTDSTKIELVKIVQAKNPVTYTKPWTALPYTPVEDFASPDGVGSDTDIMSGGQNETLSNSDIITGG